jgi:putative ABC transport system substrate-binding protein
MLLIRVIILSACIFPPTQKGDAQERRNVPIVGYLAAGAAPIAATRLSAFRTGLHDLHYIEGQNIRIEYRNSAGDVERIPRNAQELVGLPVDVIVTAGPTDTRAAKRATNTIPIVMSQDNDPIGNGFVASLARPGANITGLSTLSADLSGKRLEILKEILPRVSRIAVIGTSNTPGNATA